MTRGRMTLGISNSVHFVYRKYANSEPSKQAQQTTATLNTLSDTNHFCKDTAEQTQQALLVLQI